MIHILHNSKQLVKATHNGKEIKLPVVSHIVGQFIEIAKTFPDENLIWIKENIAQQIVVDDLISNFKGSHYMLSYGNMENHFLNPAIGYVTDGPFLAVSQKNIYPTWLMQETAGMVAASIINQFNASSYKNKSLEYFLTSVARIGQPQGLFCYHIPAAFKIDAYSNNGSSSLFQFVGQHYKTRWVFILLLCQLLYEKRYPILDFIYTVYHKKISIDLNVEQLQHIKKKTGLHESNYEVIIPTMGRAGYLKDVLFDLANQTILPEKVIIIEQNANINADTELDYIATQSWPFPIVHEFIHQTGACNARNVAISQTNSEWVLLFDDDNRFESNIMERVFKAIVATQAKVLNLAYLQKGEVENATCFKQWESFGSGCSIIHREIVEKCKFDMALEHGYGEDVDYGMQIRNAGYDIIYAPQIQLLHLKAPVGGFRKPHIFPWQDDDIQPKPSPQIMYHRRKNYTQKQLLGYKLTLFIKFYKDYSIKNPISYYNYFKKAWSNSLYWSQKLEEDAKV